MPKLRRVVETSTTLAVSRFDIRPLAYNIDIKGVREITGLSKGFIYELIAADEFPKPSKFGTRSMWFGPAVEAWVASKHGVDRIE